MDTTSAPRSSARKERFPWRRATRSSSGAAGTFSGRVTQDWRERFLRAYDIEFQEWIDAIATGGEFGPSSWDGYAAAVVSDAAVQALHDGARATVTLAGKPPLYG